MTTLALKRAKHAFDKVEVLRQAAAGRTEAQRKTIDGKYVSYIAALPATIIKSGLGQAMAMEKAGSKDDIGHKLLCQHIEEWLTASHGWPESPYRPQPNQPRNLLKAIVNNHNQKDYVRAQAEALAYLEWLKKFAVAFLDGDIPADPAPNPNPNPQTEPGA